MSVNEVKLKKAPISFQVKGTGPATSRTFVIGDEDHTIGNSARHILMQDARVAFAGYSVPHPSEPIMHVRIQCKADSGCTAMDALKDSCQTLHSQCDIVLQRLEELLPEVKEDRLQMEKIILKDNEFFEEQEEEEEDDEEILEDQDEDADVYMEE
ncbi:I and III subunit RPAC2 [Seminavis robusta]|uniref:I and III subunit RPAC2 n=1 Tax=Seminavis robusta TaxID=568900 RepID=A0A9N8E9W9_9STRA|nr:I and III subunit RPAC2 [Seminavis robusta]|eukprot:Sro656_g182450.1 I and III subunit RPAC2 (155) ;mRNA; f:41374-41838